MMHFQHTIDSLILMDRQVRMIRLGTQQMKKTRGPEAISAPRLPAMQTPRPNSNNKREH